MNSILLSFIIPAYNAEKYISRCVESVLRQGLLADRFEIIIINDGSTDATPKITQALAGNCAQIKIVNQENQGLSAARNAGIDLASGMYLWFVDADDFLFNQAARHLLEFAVSRDLEVLTFGLKEVEFSDDYAGGEFDSTAKFSDVTTGRAYIAKRNYYNTAWHYLVRRDLLVRNKIGFPIGRFMEDAIFTPTVFLSAKRMAHCDGQAYVYFRNPTSITRRRDFAHTIKMVSSLVSIAHDFQQFILECKGEDDAALSRRLKSRRDSYVFFLCLRLLFSGLPLDVIRKIYKDLRADGLVPVLQLSAEEYPGLKYRLLIGLINLQPMYYFTAWCMSVVNRPRS